MNLQEVTLLGGPYHDRTCLVDVDKDEWLLPSYNIFQPSRFRYIRRTFLVPPECTESVDIYVHCDLSDHEAQVLATQRLAAERKAVGR